MSYMKQLSDGSVWCKIEDANSLEWRLRYAPDTITKNDLMKAAGIISAYTYLVSESTQKKRDMVCRELRSE